VRASNSRKLIEVALPLDEINAASKADKDRKTGTLRNIHKWFAPMPLPACRAILFAALIDDPEDDNQRVYLLDLIKRLVKNGADLPDPDDLAEAMDLLQKQFPEGMPVVFDPFCGGGSTLVEAQRLGLPAYGSDLNPVPALIARTLVETLPKVHGQPPLHTEDDCSAGLFGLTHDLGGYSGLATDLRYYARVVRDAADERLKSLFPGDQVDEPLVWLWARTARCPNPTCGIETILTTSWWLSKRKGAFCWLEPEVIDGDVTLKLIVDRPTGSAPDAPKVGRGARFSCVGCSGLLDETWLIEQGLERKIGLRLLAVLVDDGSKRLYRLPTAVDISAAESARRPENLPHVMLPDNNARWFSGPRFGYTSQADLYTDRQLEVLTTFGEEVAMVEGLVISDGGTPEQAKAIASLLGLAVGKLAHGNSTQTRWKFDSRSGSASPEGAFGRADIPMTWDFVEVDPLGEGAKSWLQCIETMIDALPYVESGQGKVVRADARLTRPEIRGLVATDPPYFDAIGYADLSDYFYVWHRMALRTVHPDLYATIATPKSGELTAVPSHHGSPDAAREYFIQGFTDTFRSLTESLLPGLPMLVVYASKEQKSGREEETRWSSILTAVIQAELEITGTWPIHGTGSTRMIGQGTNAVASYIVMVCRPRPTGADTCSLADFSRALRRELGLAVRHLQAASILPVDLAQAAMGPGMQIFSRYRAVLDQSGSQVQVEQALRAINVALAEVLDEQEGELDPESRFAVRWWAAHGWNAGTFGEADKAVRPLGISVDDVVRAQVATSKANKVQLLSWSALDRDWVPSKDVRPTAWEAVHHLADRLIDGGGELEAGRLMGVLAGLQDSAMALVYRLHDIAAKSARTEDQERYNALISAWSELVKLSATGVSATERLF
jgi:putative DNA methylase